MSQNSFKSQENDRLPPRRVIEPIIRAAEILRLFRTGGTVLRVRDIADRTGLHKATVSRLLHSLEAAGLAEKAYPAGFRSLVNICSPRKLRVGYASQNERAQFPALVTKSLKSAAQDDGVELIVFDNQFSAETTLRNVEEMLTQTVDSGIVFSTIQSIAAEVGSRFLRANVPLVAVEMPIPGASFYGANNYAAGWTAGIALGRYARNHWRSKIDHIVLVELPEAGALPQLRLSAAVAGIKEIVPTITQSKIVHLDGRNEFEASCFVVKEWLSEQRRGNVLLAAVNDPSAMGSLAALKEASRLDDYAVIGQNATPDARREMRQPASRLIGSVAYRPEQYGAELMRMAIQLAQRKTLPSATYAKHLLVTPGNVDRIFPEDRTEGLLPVFSLPSISPRAIDSEPESNSICCDSH